MELLRGGVAQSAVTLEVGDVEIGAVEMKDGTTDTRAKVAATSSVAEGDSALAVQAPVLGATTGAALSADGNGTLQQYARSLFKEFLARIGAVDGAALTVDGNGTLQQYLRSLMKAVGWYDDAAATTTGTLSAKLRGLLIVTGVTTDAAVITDANGTLQGYLRGLVKLFAARMLTRRQCLNASETVAISGTTAKNATAGLAVGDYLISANVFCFIRQGVWATITSTVAAGTPLFAGESIIVPVTTVGADDGIAAITEGASGSLYIKGAEAL